MAESANTRTAILGIGTMGEALAQGLLASGEARPEDLVGTARRPERARRVSESLGIRVELANEAAVRGADVVLLCTKPKALPGLLTELAETAAVVSRDGD